MPTEVTVVIWFQDPPLEQDLRQCLEDDWDGNVMEYEEEDV